MREGKGRAEEMGQKHGDRGGAGEKERTGERGEAGRKERIGERERSMGRGWILLFYVKILFPFL